MRLPKILSKLLVASLVLAASIEIGHAQTTEQEECEAVECMSPAFDVGIVFQPPVGYYGITELMIAVEGDDVAKVNALLTAGADPNLRNDAGATALLMASAHGNREIVEQLLSAGADPDIASSRGDTPLAAAIQYKHASIAVALLRHRANPNVYHNADNPGLRKHALVRAAVLGQTDVVRLMIEHGVDVSEGGLEALNTALWQHHEEVAALLVGTDINLNAPTYDGEKYPHMQNGERVLHTAAQQGLVSSTRLLLEQGADVNDRNVREESALYFAVKEKHPAVVALLLDAGAIVVGDDVAAALKTGDEVTALQLMKNIDLSTLGITELDTLIGLADSINSPEVLNHLFAARGALDETAPVTTLLFARADTDNCELAQWNFVNGQQATVFSSPGQCEQGFYFNRPRGELYVVDGYEIDVISLDNPESTTRVIELPAAMIEKNLAALKEQMNVTYEGIDSSWVTARIVQVGILASGEFAFVTHSSGPADGTYGYLYAMAGSSWRLVRSESCHRFDPCRFNEIFGHSIDERPSDMTAWHPEIRRNPYFIDKTESRVVNHEYLSWNGVITFNIDGQQSLLQYTKGESGHCVDDCAYTTGLKLELPGQGIVDIGQFGGNNSIVDRYALVWTHPRTHTQLFDLATGQSVFGKLQTAGWVY